MVLEDGLTVLSVLSALSTCSAAKPACGEFATGSARHLAAAVSVTAAVLCLLGVKPATGSTMHQEPVEVAKIGARVFTLHSGAAACSLTDKATGKAVQLDLPGPCRFSRRGSTSAPQQYDYAKVGTVVYVFGKPAAIETLPGKPQVKESDRCSTHGQAVILRRSGNLELRPAVSNGLFCARLGLDEKDFYAAAFPVKK